MNQSNPDVKIASLEAQQGFHELRIAKLETMFSEHMEKEEKHWEATTKNLFRIQIFLVVLFLVVIIFGLIPKGLAEFFKVLL